MQKRKPYVMPKVVQVELRQEQAVLVLCNQSATSTSIGTGDVLCNTTCRKESDIGNSGRPPS